MILHSGSTGWVDVGIFYTFNVNDSMANCSYKGHLISTTYFSNIYLHACRILYHWLYCIAFHLFS